MRRHASVRCRRFARFGRLSVATLVIWPLTVGAGVAQAAPQRLPSVATAIVAGLDGYTPMSPVRICDTRAMQPPTVAANRCNHAGASAGTLIGPASMTVAVAGLDGVPMTATSVVLNVTATGTSAASFLTVWPTGQARPNASNLNWVAGQSVPNLAEVALGATNGSVDVFNFAGTADVVIDLEGYVDAGGTTLFTPAPPQRICDTRASGSGVPANGCNVGGAGTLGPGKQVLVATIAPPGVITAAVLNVTVTNTTAASFLTVWPDGTPPPTASNLNWAPGQTVPNRVIVPVGTDGKVEIFNAAGKADVVIDVNGYFTTQAVGSGFVPFAPIRTCDTRPTQPPFVPDNRCNPGGGGTGGLGAGDAIVVPFAFPASDQITALVLNVTVTKTTASGFLTVFPDNAPEIPLASDLNWAAGQTVANLVVVKLPASDQQVVFFNSAGNTDVIIDIEGVYTSAPAAATSIAGTAARAAAATAARAAAGTAARAPAAAHRS